MFPKTQTLTASLEAASGETPEASLQRLERQFIAFLETGKAPPGLFRPDVFLDYTPPLWRLQAQGLAAVVLLRLTGHPAPGSVPRWRTDRTGAGFVMEFEEEWEQDGKRWYSREIARADVVDGAITALSVYCTGDWDEERRETHRRQQPLIRP